jgi:hypothetical protein
MHFNCSLHSLNCVIHSGVWPWALDAKFQTQPEHAAWCDPTESGVSMILWKSRFDGCFGSSESGWTALSAFLMLFFYMGHFLSLIKSQHLVHSLSRWVSNCLSAFLNCCSSHSHNCISLCKSLLWAVFERLTLVLEGSLLLFECVLTTTMSLVVCLMLVVHSLTVIFSFLVVIY